MKARVLIILALMVILITACHSDGEASISIDYQTETDVETISIKDDSNSNGIYVDKENNQLYCQKGPNNVVKLPFGAQWVAADNPLIELDVRLVCMMGQEKFDRFLKLFELVHEP